MLALRTRLQPPPENPLQIEDEFYPGPMDTHQATPADQCRLNTVQQECPRCRRMRNRAARSTNHPQPPLRDLPIVDIPEQTADSPLPIQPDWLRVQEHSWSTDLFDQPITFLELRWVGQDDQINLPDKENTPPKINNNNVEYLLPVINYKQDATDGASEACTPQAL